jgi:uncharacterized protein (TIGR00725 family)
MYQICVSGAAKGKSMEEGGALGKLAGEAIAKGGHALLTGATTGIPLKAAQAYKRAGGVMSVGISPAASKVEHVMKYRLPTQPYDAIIYTGMHYVGRDLFLINSSDAVISIGGRLGTLHETLIALETETPIALLHGAGGTGDELLEILRTAGREPGDDTIFGDDVGELLDKLVVRLDIEHKKYIDLYR